MIKRLLILDGVLAVCRFRDDGAYVERLWCDSGRNNAGSGQICP